MDLSSISSWRQLPWIRATLPQWRYALRVSLAACLALSFAYGLDLDQPYWSMTSAIVVGFPTVGGAISKSMGRIAGSLIGATASLIIAGHTLNDPWLFTLSMACWLSCCTWISGQYQNNASYAFALAGYTAAIIAFSMVNTLETTELWDIAQARVCEVMVGILCGAGMMMVLPSSSDANALVNALKNMHGRLLEHASLLLKQEVTDTMPAAHESLISQILTLNLLRIQAFWSHYRFRQRNALFNYLLHQQLRMTSVISSLRRILLSWDNPPKNLAEILNQLMTLLAQPDTDKYQVARLISQLETGDPSDYRFRAFWMRLRYFCSLYINNSRWLRQIENASPITILTPPSAHALARHTDKTESAWNALRTFVVITVTGAWSISTQWEAGSEALSLAAISCVLYSSSNAPFVSINLLLRTLLALTVFSFLVKFGLMIQVSHLWAFLAFLFPLLITIQLLKQQHPKYAGALGQFAAFMGSFIAVTNPPQYDYASFLNDNLAKVIGVGMTWVAFSVLRPSSDKRKGRRHVRALRRSFIDQISRHPRYSEAEFESLVYHHISQLSNSKDEASRRWLLRWGVVLLNCTHVAWQLRAWETRSDPLSRVRDTCIVTMRNIMSERGVQQRTLATALAELLRISEALSRHHQPEARDLAAIIWRLYCSLRQLEQAPAQSNDVSG